MKSETRDIDKGFEESYIAVRGKERRMYSDEELLHLPDIAVEHPHYGEWKLRKESAERLKKYLAGKDRPLKILEVGSGNGWLSYFLSSIPNSNVTGVDINLTEIIQAQRVFHQRPNLRFVHGDIKSPEIANAAFDCIVFAACIQYFASPKDIISYALQQLKKEGEIHVLDSNFYKPGDIGPAQKRTAGYYNSLGVPRLTAYYFHHSFEELDPFSYDILYNPSFLNRHILQNKNPFPWIRIKRKT